MGPACPNLRTLKILSSKFTAPYKCLYLAPPEEGDAVMRLDSLELNGPIFYNGEQEYGCTKQEISPLAFLDLSSLRRLSLTHPGHLLDLLSTSMNLRYLSLDFALFWVSDCNNSGDALLTSIFTNQRLEELVLTGCINVLTIDSMKALRGTLKCLKIHENEDEFAICKRRVFSDQEIQNLGETFPTLEYLSLDVNYDGQWVCYQEPPSRSSTKSEAKTYRTPAIEDPLNNIPLIPIAHPPRTKSRNQHIKPLATPPPSSHPN